MAAHFGRCLAGMLVIGLVGANSLGAQQDEPPPRPAEETAPPAGMDVLARGPVHEAYAEVTVMRPEPSPLVTKEPPVLIDEVPPDQKPEGEDVVWIPGYWAYDEDEADY